MNGGTIFALLFFGLPMFFALRALYQSHKKHPFKLTLPPSTKLIDCFKALPHLLPMILIALVAAIVIGAILHSIGIAIGIAISPFCSFIEPVLGIVIVGIMTLSSVTLVFLGLVNLLYWHKKDMPGIFSILFGGIIAYFFIFHFWPKHLGY